MQRTDADYASLNPSSTRSHTALSDRRAVSVSRSNDLIVRHTATGACERVLEEHTRDVNCVSVLPDGRVVSESLDNTLRVWDV